MKRVPCEKFIYYLHLKGKNICDFIKQNFMITLDEKDIKKIIDELPEKPKKTILKSKYKKNMHDYEEFIGLEDSEMAVDSLIKVSSYKKLTFFINTCLYRRLEVPVIVEVINSTFSDEESHLAFSQEDIEFYKKYIFDFEDMSPYFKNKFIKSNSDIADFHNKLHISEVASKSDIYIQLDPERVINNILNVSFFKAMNYLKSGDKDDVRLGKVLADFAIKNLKDTKQIIGEDAESELDTFTVEFEKNNANAPIIIDELEKD